MKGKNKSGLSKVVLSIIIVMVMIFSQSSFLVVASGTEAEMPKGTDVTPVPEVMPNEKEASLFNREQCFEKDEPQNLPIENRAGDKLTAEKGGTYPEPLVNAAVITDATGQSIPSAPSKESSRVLPDNQRSANSGSKDSANIIEPMTIETVATVTSLSDSSILTYDSNGSVSGPWTDMFVSNQPFRIIDAIPTMPGGNYVFRGWTTQQVDVADGANYSGSIFQPREFAILTGSITLYALWAYCDSPQQLPFSVEANLAESTQWSPYTWERSFCYSFSLDSGQMLVARMDSSIIDSYLILYDESGNIVEYNDDSGGGLNAFLRYYTFEPGTFYLHATVWYNSSQNNGTFSLSVMAGSDIISLNYDVNGGMNLPQSFTTLANTIVPISSVIPTRAGHIFMGWSTSMTANNADYAPGDTYVLGTTSRTLFAVWSPYTAISSPYSGSNTLSSADGFSAFGTYMKGFSIDLSVGQVLSISMLTDDFWAYLLIHDSDGLFVNYYGHISGDNYFAEYTVTSPGTYYIDATIEPGDYSRSSGEFTLIVETSDLYMLIYDANGGYLAPEPELFDPGQSITISPLFPYRTGYIFMGWASSPEATTAQYRPYDNFIAYEYITLFAVWEAYAPVQLPYSSADTINPDDGLSRRGTLMKGYSFYAPAGSVIVAAMESNNVDSYLYLLNSDWYQVAYNDDSFDDYGEWTLNSKISYMVEISGMYYLQATTNSLATGDFNLSIYLNTTHTITYDAQGGFPTPPPLTYISGEVAWISNVLPIRLGYTFMGWNTEISGNGAYYQRYLGYIYDYDLMLYAIWSPCDFAPNEISLPLNTYGQIASSSPLLEAFRSIRYGVYSVWLTSGQEVTILMESSDFDSYLYLLAPDEILCAFDDDSGGYRNAMIRYTVPVTGRYYIIASQYSGTIYGSYNLRLISGIASTISYSTQGGTPYPDTQVKLPGETAWISNQLPIRLGYTFMGWNTDPWGDGTYYQRGQMYASDANLYLYAIWSSHGFGYPHMEPPFSEEGHITAYSPVLEDNSGKRYEVYCVWLTSGQEYTISMESYELDSYLYLLSPWEQYITENDDSGGNRNAKITYYVPTTGWYYILASQYWGNSYGSYTLSVKTQSTVRIRTSTATGRAGDSVTVALSLEENPGLASLALDIYYDASGLAVESIASVRRGPALGGLIFTGVTDTTYTNNPFRVSWFGTSNDYTHGDILLITFRILETAEDGYYDVWANYMPANTRDEDLDLVLLTSWSGGVSVFNFTYGDTDGDKVVTLGDAIRIAQYINIWPVDIITQAADVDGDGAVTLADAILIAQYVNGWFEKFPVERNITQANNIAPFSIPTPSSQLLGNNPTVSVVNPSKSVKQGETVTVEVRLEGNTGLASLTLDIGYDTNVFELVSQTSVRNGAALGSLLFTGLTDETYQNNPFRVSWFGTENDDSDGVILSIDFKVKDDAADGDYNITVDYSPGNTRDEDLNLVALDAVDASVTVNEIVTAGYKICCSDLQPAPKNMALNGGGVAQFYATLDGVTIENGIKWLIADTRLATVSSYGLVSVNKNKYTGQLVLMLYSSENKLLDSITLRII